MLIRRLNVDSENDTDVIVRPTKAHGVMVISLQVSADSQVSVSLQGPSFFAADSLEVPLLEPASIL